MPLTGLHCHVSKLANSDACLRPTAPRPRPTPPAPPPCAAHGVRLALATYGARGVFGTTFRELWMGNANIFVGAAPGLRRLRLGRADEPGDGASEHRRGAPFMSVKGSEYQVCGKWSIVTRAHAPRRRWCRGWSRSPWPPTRRSRRRRRPSAGPSTGPSARGPSAPTDLSPETRALVPVLAGFNRRWRFRPRSTHVGAVVVAFHAPGSQRTVRMRLGVEHFEFVNNNTAYRTLFYMPFKGVSCTFVKVYW